MKTYQVVSESEQNNTVKETHAIKKRYCSSCINFKNNCCTKNKIARRCFRENGREKKE